VVEKLRRGHGQTAWFGLLLAPQEGVFNIDHVGHSGACEGYAELHRIRTEIVLPTTYSHE
jgi:hypothetical protein